MATYRSKAMANKNPDSMVDREWMRNIWVRQALKLISLSLNQNLGKGSGAKHQVIQREHAEEEIHGLMKTGVHLDDEHKDTIPHQSQ